MVIKYYSRFERHYKRLPLEIREVAETKEAVFRNNPFDKRLDTHKLHGRLKNHWSFSVIRQYRILFIFEKSDVIFLDIGDHDIYQ